jgi:hypothetical protein
MAPRHRQSVAAASRRVASPRSRCGEMDEPAREHLYGLTRGGTPVDERACDDECTRAARIVAVRGTGRR